MRERECSGQEKRRGRGHAWLAHLPVFGANRSMSADDASSNTRRTNYQWFPSAKGPLGRRDVGIWGWVGWAGGWIHASAGKQPKPALVDDSWTRLLTSRAGGSYGGTWCQPPPVRNTQPRLPTLCVTTSRLIRRVVPCCPIPREHACYGLSSRLIAVVCEHPLPTWDQLPSPESTYIGTANPT